MKKYSQLLFLCITLILIQCKVDDISEMREISINEMLTDDYSITMNPSGRNLLSASIRTSSLLPSIVEAQVVGEHPVQVRTNSTDSGIIINLFGLYPNQINKIALKFTDIESRWAQDTVEISGPSIPDHLPDVKVISDQRPELTMTLAGFSLGNNGVFETYPLLIDQYGEIRGVLDFTELEGIAFPVKPLANGNLITGRAERIVEYNWMGEVINEWNIPGYYQHHEIVEMTDGNFLVAVGRQDLPTVEDHIIEIDRQTGEVLREWDLRQILDVDRFDLVQNEWDWFHMNAIWYIEEEDAIITSGRNQGVVKISGDNELIWILAPHKGWGKAGLNGEGFETRDYLLQAVNVDGIPYESSIQQGIEDADNFSWAWGQHAPMLLDNGHLFLFDNGFNRNFTGNNLFSRGVEYQIDEENKTVRQVWQYGKERGESFYSAIISDVDINNVGNRVITAGIINEGGPKSSIVEVDENGQVIYELELLFKNAFVNGQGWGNLDICYRSEQIQFDR